MKHSQHKQHKQRQHQSQQLRSPIAAARIRALNFILEQNRLLQRDNKALIGMVKRLQDQLDEKNGASGKQGKSKKRR